MGATASSVPEWTVCCAIAFVFLPATIAHSIRAKFAKRTTAMWKLRRSGSRAKREVVEVAVAAAAAAQVEVQQPDTDDSLTASPARSSFACRSEGLMDCDQ